MRPLSVITAVAMLASEIAAIPTDKPDFVDNRRSRDIINKPRQRKETPTIIEGTNADTGGPGGWAGAIQEGRTGVSTVSATVTVPTPATPPDGSSDTRYGGVAWVGIDGVGVDVLWQAGVTWWVEGTTASFSGWYVWVNPEQGAAQPFSGFTVSPGDTISMKVVATTSTSGTAYLENETTGVSVQKTLTGQSGLPQTSAEWILEDFGISGGSVPFAAFSPAVAFTNCGFTDSTGTQGLSGADIVNISNSNGDFTDTIQNSNSELTVTYTGNASWS